MELSENIQKYKDGIIQQIAHGEYQILPLDEVTLNGESVALSNNQATIKIDKKDDYTLTAKAHDEAGNESSIDMEFTYASEINLLLIGIIAGAVIVLLLLILLIMKKRRA